MLSARRRARVIALEALDREVKQFRIREDLFPLRVPHEPLLLHDILDRVPGDDLASLDLDSLRSRTLLALEWPEGDWSVWLTMLPSGLKLFCDSNGDEVRVLASGGRNAGDESERLFLQLLCESGGAHFGLEMSGGAPARVRSTIADREFLVDLFVELFEGSAAEREIKESAGDIDAAGDFRVDVERWLASALARVTA